MKTIFLILISFITINAQSELLTLFGGGYTPETTEYKRLIDSVGGSITAPDLLAIDAFVKSTSTIRSKIVRFNPFAGNDLTTALVPLFRGTATGEVIGNAIDVNQLFETTNYTRTTGLGDTTNTTKSIRTAVNPSTTGALGLDDAGVGVWVLSMDYSSAAASLMFLNNTNYYGLSYNTASPYYIFWYPPNAQTELNRTGYGTNWYQGLHYVSRTASNKSNLYYNADSVATSNAASIAEVNSEFWLFARNGSSPASQGKFYSSGYVITKGLTKAEYVILYNAWNTLKTAFGR